MLCAVVGCGPRTGTTFVMKSCHEAGLPVAWNPTLNIPGAGYDLLPSQMFNVEHGIIKIWPPALRHCRITRAVVLRRDYEAQLVSAHAQKAREDAAGAIFDDGRLGVEEALEIHHKALGRWLLSNRRCEVLDVRTEDLDERIGEIVDWLAQPFMRQVA